LKSSGTKSKRERKRDLCRSRNSARLRHS
jgi:hypothetical protein